MDEPATIDELHRRLAVAEALLRENDEAGRALGQSFLLTLSDALRAEDGVEAVADRAVRMVADELGRDRFYLVSIDQDADRIDVTHEARRECIARSWARITARISLGNPGDLGSEVMANSEDYWLDAFRGVALTGDALRMENHDETTHRWYTVHLSRAHGPSTSLTGPRLIASG